MMENAPEVVAAPGCNLSSNEDVAEAEPSLADEATSDLEPAYRGNKEIEQDITLEDICDHSNLRGATANAESIFYGSAQREETTPNIMTQNIMNLEAKASGGDSSITELGVQDDLSMVHGGQDPEVVAWGKSRTEDTDSVGMAGEEVARPKQARLAPEVEAASLGVDEPLFEVESPENEEEEADLDRLETERLDGDRIMDEVAHVQRRMSPKNPPPGPGWTSKKVTEGMGISCFYWISPIRHIPFRRYKPACQFEELRKKNDNDEVRAWSQYRRDFHDVGKVVVSPKHYDQRDTLPSKTPPPRPGRATKPNSERAIEKTANIKRRQKSALNKVSLSKPVRKTTRKATGQRSIKKIGAKRTGMQSSISIEASPSKSLHPPPGPGWKFDEAREAGREYNVCHWFSPIRKIEFLTWKQACEFEGLRKQFGAGEIKAWAEYRKINRGGRTRVVTPYLYDAEPRHYRANKETTGNTSGTQEIHLTGASASKSSRRPPPGPGWETKLVKNQGRNRFHWLSPIRRIEFVRYQPACRFEQLRKKNDNDEVRAWHKYRSIGGQTFVVSPQQYDQHDSLTEDTDSVEMAGEEVARPKQARPAPEVETASVEVDGILFEVVRPEEEEEQADLDRLETERLDGDRIMDEVADVQRRMSAKNPPPGPGWESKLVKCKGQNRFHWLSPSRRIEFKKYKPACQFEELRKKNGNDEVRAWHKYRRDVRGETFVVSPQQYDQHDSLTEDTDSVGMAGEEVARPKQARLAPEAETASVEVDELLFEAGHPEEEEEPVLDRINNEQLDGDRIMDEVADVQRRMSPKNPPPGPGWTSKKVAETVGSCFHWFSPGRHIQFKRYKQACQFEKLREENDNDEVRAWDEYRRDVHGLTCVVSPHLYDSEPWINRATKETEEIHLTGASAPKSSRCPPPGPGWESNLVKCKGQNRLHWLSPSRRIEFRKYQAACQFEKLRKKNDNDEVRAWHKYRRDVRGETFVVSPRQYDQHDSLTEDTDSVGMAGEEVARPKQARLAPEAETASVEVDDILFEAGHPEEEEEPVLDRINNEQLDGDRIMDEVADVQRRMSPKNPPPGPGWTSKKVVEGAGYSRFHWLSPIRHIQFERYQPACRFEELREENDNDEVRAWHKYRSIGGQTFVVSPQQYDQHDSLTEDTDSVGMAGEEVVRPKQARLAPEAETASVEVDDILFEVGHPEEEEEPVLDRINNEQLDGDRIMDEVADVQRRNSPKNPPPGPGWTSKKVAETVGSSCFHWFSPGRHIQFRRHPPACRFEKLRAKNDNDEVRAWDEYRRDVRGETFVVSPHLYDAEPRQNRATKETTGNMSGTQEIHLIGTSASKSLTGASSSKSSRSSLTRPVHTTERVTEPSKATVRRKPMVIDQEWALSLVGLRLKVPEPWWNGYSGNTLYAGQIAAVNFSDNAKPFMFELDNEENGESYRMRYDAVRLYADKGHPTHSRFNLPEEPPVDPNVTRSGKRKGREEHSQAVSKAQKLQKTSHVAAKKLPNASIKSKSKNCLVIKSTKKCRSTPAPKLLHDKEHFMDCPFQSSSQSTFLHDGVNSSDIMTICLKPTKKKTFFRELFKGRVHIYRKFLSDVPPEKSVQKDGKKYFLASAKLMRDKMVRFPEEKKIELAYINKNGLQQELEKLCCFGSLKPEKVIARLAMFQSEAQQVVYTKASKIELIEEEGHEGCGFYPEGFFGSATKKSCDAIQVRILSPTIGFAKGMLLKKRGINCIQLPSSMIKVPPSETCTDSWAAILIKNEFPSEENRQMGRFLDPDAANANKSWMKNDRRKQLSKMYRRMLIGYGVKESDVSAYTRAAKTPMYLKHAHLKGCIDPTGAIPQKKVFISGYTIDSDKNRALFGKVHTKVYLSRSPSLEPADAKLVSVIGSKPKEMSEDDWDMLCSYGFGTIIFPRSNEGSTPLSCVIADGDLDGDDYFVMWDEKIIHHLIHSDDKLTLKARRELNKLELPAGAKSVDKATKFAKSSDSEWLSKAQDKMLDFPRQKAATQLVGRLYGLCNDSSKRPCGSINLFDKNAIAYAKAYKDAMDVQKHGGTVNLPGHLHENLPRSLQHVLTSREEKSS